MSSQRGPRVCPACQTGYIFDFDLHARCESCLGPDHAGLALTPQASCPYCARLPQSEKQRRADAFAVAAEDVWPVKEVYSLGEARDIFDAEEPETDVSASSIHGSPGGSPIAPLPLAGEQELDGGPSGFHSGDPGVPFSAVTALPAIGGLLRELPEIIEKAAACKGLVVPPGQVSAPPDDMSGEFAAAQLAKREPIWPRFPAIVKYQSGAAVEPGKLKAPVTTYAPITKVEGFTDRGFPPVPPLESNLTAFFGVKPTNAAAGRRPAPSSSKDQMTCRLADRSHQCAFQASAAANNIALLAYSLSKLDIQPDSPPTAQVAEVRRASSAILTLSASVAVSAARIAAWQTQIHRNLWLHQSSIPDTARKELLDGPISPDGLFGPQFPAMVSHLRAASEEAENIRKHVAWSQPATRSQRPSGQWRDRRDQRDQRQRQRRPAAAAAAASRPPAPPAPAPLPLPPAAHTAPQRGYKTRRMACTWSNPGPQEPPRKQSRKQ